MAPAAPFGTESRIDRWCRRIFLALLALVVAACNVVIGWVWFCQIRSAFYPTTEGVVLGHKTVEPGKRRRLAFEYEYEVNGVRWISDRGWCEAYGPNEATESAVRARFPQGARVRVAYNGANPADAVLLPGLQGVDVIALWPLTALNLLLFFCLGYLRHEPPTSVDRLITTTPFGWRFVPVVEPIWQVFGVLLCVAFLPCGFVAHQAFDMFPSVWQVLALTAAAAGTAGAVARPLCPGAWLDVDVVKRELRWHPGALRGATLTLPFAAIRDIRTVERPYAEFEYADWAEIDWSGSDHQTRTLAFPPWPEGAAPLEGAVARLREAVFGPPPDPHAPAIA